MDQYRVKIVYNVGADEEFLIHSDETIEWIEPRRDKTTGDLVTMVGGAHNIIDWLKTHNARRLGVSCETES